MAWIVSFMKSAIERHLKVDLARFRASALHL